MGFYAGLRPYSRMQGIKANVMFIILDINFVVSLYCGTFIGTEMAKFETYNKTQYISIKIFIH